MRVKRHNIHMASKPDRHSCTTNGWGQLKGCCAQMVAVVGAVMVLVVLVVLVVAVVAVVVSKLALYWLKSGGGSKMAGKPPYLNEWPHQTTISTFTRFVCGARACVDGCVGLA